VTIDRFSPTRLGRVSTVEALATTVRERILSGQEVPGTPLREAELCQLYGVARHSLRAALQSLSHDGLVVHVPNRGVFVAALTAADVADIYALREALEVQAVTLLASAPGKAVRAEQALQRLVTLPVDAPWQSVRDADLGFHQALVEDLDRPRTSRTFTSLLDELRLAFLQLKPELEDHAEVARQHEEIYASVQRGDGEGAAELIRSHLRTAQQDITASFAGDAEAEPASGG
jgi:DNA-binding GntR family transcriptional regulator